MAEPIAERNLARYNVNKFGAGSKLPFCLVQVASYEPEQPATGRKRRELILGQTEALGRQSAQQSCSIGGCTLRIVENTAEGRTVSGQCKAASYCLKTAFAEVKDASTTEEGRALYRKILDSLEGSSDSYNAGNFCPRLNCGLSAGVSVDMIPGTSGTCERDAFANQQCIDFENGEQF
jgi:hypothetical protein